VCPVCPWTVCRDVTAALHYFADALGTMATNAAPSRILASGSWILASNANKTHVIARITVWNKTPVTHSITGQVNEGHAKSVAWT